MTAPQQIGGATSPAPEASPVAGGSSRNYPAPAGVPAGAGAFLQGPYWTEARYALAVHLYRTDPSDKASILARVNAVDADRKQPMPSWRTLQSRMTYDRVERTPLAQIEALKRRGRKQDDPTLQLIRARMAEGVANSAIAEEIGISLNSLYRLQSQHNIGRPNKEARRAKVLALAEQGADAVAAAFGVHRRTAIAFMREAGVPPSKGGRPLGARTQNRNAPSPVVLHVERKPPKPRAVVQTVEEYLAAGGKITRCPTVALLQTQARIPQADMDALKAYYADKPTGNWRQQRIDQWKLEKQRRAEREREAAEAAARGQEIAEFRRDLSAATAGENHPRWHADKLMEWRK